MMFGCKTDVTSLMHAPEGMLFCFHVCCLSGPWGYPMSHSNPGNRKAEKQIQEDFSFNPCPNLKHINEAFGSFAQTAFLFNNSFIYYSQKPVFFLNKIPSTSLKVRLCFGAGLFRRQESLDYTAIPAGIQTPSPHKSVLPQRETIAGTTS